MLHNAQSSMSVLVSAVVESRMLQAHSLNSSTACIAHYTATAAAHSFAGQSVEYKLEAVRAALRKAGAGSLVVCALDEVAYLFNIRGGDVAHCPVALAYALVSADSAELFVDSAKLTPAVSTHLAGAGVSVRPYSEAIPALRARVSEHPAERVWVDPARVTFALHDAVPAERRVTEATPLSLAKALKNSAELSGMRAAHVRDGAALSEFLHWLDVRVTSGTPVSEVEVDAELSGRRAAQQGFVDLSFPTIAGAGANGAVIHYRAEASSCGHVTDSCMFLLDSGAQYEVSVSLFSYCFSYYY
jgi:Xaa-Pro aminopeptidase